MNKRGTSEETSVGLDTRPAENFKLRKRLLLLPILQLLALSLFTRPIFSAAGPPVLAPFAKETTPTVNTPTKIAEQEKPAVSSINLYPVTPELKQYNPDLPSLEVGQGILYTATGEYEKAFDVLVPFAEKNPNDIHCLKAIIALAESADVTKAGKPGNPEIVLKTLDYLLHHYPSTSTRDFGLLYHGEHSFAEEKYDAVITLFSELTKNDAKELNGEWRSDVLPMIYYFLGQAYIQKKQPDEAISAWQKLVNEFPDNRFTPMVLFSVGFNARRAGKKELAKEKFLILLEKYTDPETIIRAKVQLGELYKEENNPEKAIPLYEDLAGTPDWKKTDFRKYIKFSALQKLADLYQKKNDKNKALETYGRIVECAENDSDSMIKRYAEKARQIIQKLEEEKTKATM